MSVCVRERESETEQRPIEMSASYYKKNDSLFSHRYNPPTEDHIKTQKSSLGVHSFIYATADCWWVRHVFIFSSYCI